MAGKYQDKYADVWSQMPISDNVLDLRGRAIEMTQEGRKRWDDMNQPEQFDPPDRNTKLSRDAGIEDYDRMLGQEQQPFGTVQYNEGRPQSLMSGDAVTNAYTEMERDLQDLRAQRANEGQTQDAYTSDGGESYSDGNEGEGGEGEDYAQGGSVQQVRRSNMGVEDHEEVGYDADGRQNMAQGGVVQPQEVSNTGDEDLDAALMTLDDEGEGENAALEEEANTAQEANSEEGTGGEFAIDPMLASDEQPDDAFATNSPTYGPADNGTDDGDDGDDEQHALPAAVRSTLDYSRQQAGLGNSPETDERGVLPAPDVTAALAAAMEDPAAEEKMKASKMTGYLSGKGALNPQEAKSLEAQVDPTGTMDPDELRVAVINYAQQKLGPQAAAAYMAYARQQFDISKHFAIAAASGTAQKPADLGAAASAANRAFSYLPDGRNVTFIPSRNGMQVRVG